jgi:hypothetical protein
MSPRSTRWATVIVCGLAASVARAQSEHPEVEPNDSKTQATPVTLAPGDWISGSSTGSGTAAGPTSADYFLIQTAPLPLGIYRHRLTHSDTGHIGMIRGLMQDSGVITTSEEPVQSSQLTGFSQWYGFGRQERLYYRVSGTDSTTAAYTATLSTDAITPTVLAMIPPGQTTFTTAGQTGSPPTDTDLWIYDSTLHPIPGFGNDDTSLQEVGSTLTRTLTSGTYYLAITSYNLANDQASPPDDYYGFGPVMDFADVVANSDETAPLNISFRITDANEAVTNVFATKPGPFEIAWFKFDVGVPAPCYANCDHSTSPPILNVIDFTCFLQKFAAGDPYANCDGSTAPPTLNVIDFTCFLQKFAAGCSAP